MIKLQATAVFGLLIVAEIALGGEIVEVFDDSFALESRGPIEKNLISQPEPLGMGYKPTDTPSGFRLKNWVIADPHAEEKRRSFWCIPRRADGTIESYAIQAGRSKNSIAYAAKPVPKDASEYTIRFRQWSNDNDYIGYIVGASEPVIDHDGAEFGYTRQLPGTDKTSNDAYLQGVLGTQKIKGKALRQEWVDHRIEVEGNLIRWFQNNILMASAFVDSLEPGGYFGIRQRFERGTRYDDVRIETGITSTPPQVHDPQLRLDLIAEDPAIVTPIGLAIDEHDQLFVLESHTHERPADYDGPKTDRIRRFTDRDGDGNFEDTSIFAEGIQTGMNLSFSPDGVLHVVCATTVLALHDTDENGVCDEKRELLSLQTESTYGHSALLGITFDRSGKMYVSRGNVGGRSYRLQGADDSCVEGYGDGGNIIRCNSDGTDVQQWATGFWNPFQIKFDANGRLLCVDNDPDARGPNRLIHVVQGGDYGHRIMYGGAGNHPFQGWDGDLPGTLPYVGGTGEAPCDLIDCRMTSFPDDYAESVLVTVWNENTIERHATRVRGVSLQSDRETLVSGDENFRPVAITADSRGNVYFTDWVLVNYPNHGHGRIWRVSVKDASNGMRPHAYFDQPLPSPEQLQLDSLLSADASINLDAIKSGLVCGDPFRSHAAVYALAQSATSQMLSDLAEDETPAVRLGALLASLRSGTLRSSQRRAIVSRALADPNLTLRHAALVAVGTDRLTDLKSDIPNAIKGTEVTAVLLDAYLAALECLEPRFVRAFESRTISSSKKIPRTLPDCVLDEIVVDSDRPDELRILALERIDGALAGPVRAMLYRWIDSNETNKQLAAIRRLALDDKAQPMLLQLATDVDQLGEVRAEAILFLGSRADFDVRSIQPLLTCATETVAVQAARTMAHRMSRSEAIEISHQLAGTALPPGAIESLRYASGMDNPNRPKSTEDWRLTISRDTGDASAGRRVFYSVAATCSNCHTIGGTGGALGPDLSNISQSVNRDQIIDSILEPSKQFAPQYQAWTVLDDDGKVHTGLQLDHKKGGAIELLSVDGTELRFEAEEISQYRAAENSIMPTGLEQALTVSEVQDLVAYLESLR